MTSIQPITSSSRALALITAPPRLEKDFSLAMDTLKHLPLVTHEIDEHGFPTIPHNIKLDKLTEREGELLLYLARVYEEDTILRERLTNNDTYKFNYMLQELSKYNPLELIRSSVAELNNFDLLKQNGVATLLKRDPKLAMTLITACDCGLKSDSSVTKLGALNLIAIITKFTEHEISVATEINERLLENLSDLILIRKVLERVQDKELDKSVRETANSLDYEIELFEEFAYSKCIELKQEIH